MIKVVYSSNSLIVTGHANYDDYGKDIVCASVSSLITCTVNGIYSLNKNSILYKDDSNIVLDDVKVVTSRVINTNIFDLINAIVEKNIDKALEVYDDLKVQYYQLHLLIWCQIPHLSFFYQ